MSIKLLTVLISLRVGSVILIWLFICLQIGCTTLRRAFLAMQGAIPKESVGWLHVAEMRYLEPGMLILNTVCPKTLI